jgi:type I site-specific restriction-modification system R (restriction) subunit
MSRLTESAIETFAIQLFERLGYDSLYAPDIAPDSDHPERSRYDEVLLSGRLNGAVQRITPSVPHHTLQQAIKEVASNGSAMELMQHDQLRELAVVLTQKVRENASIDWMIKENVRAKLKVIVKRLLRQKGYPPDMQLLATETVLKQAEMIANELADK